MDDATVSSDQSVHEDIEANPDDIPVAVDDATVPPVPEPKEEVPTKPVSRPQSKTKAKGSRKKSVGKSILKPATPETVELQKEPVSPVKKNASKEVSEKVILNVEPEKKAEPSKDDNNNTDKKSSSDKQDTETNANTTDVEKEQEIKLPTYICPSSEKKSREAALKHWLSTTCFRSGHREIPIV